MTGGGPERLVLALALFVPLAIAGVTLGQFAGTGVAAPALTVMGSTDPQLYKRPAVSQPQVPPTLAPPTLTPAPTSTPVPTPTPKPKTYVVKPGDELKYIAAEFGVDIFKLIRVNSIPNPDSLRIGQELQIPED